MKALHFGAGNIGRGFIGLLLHQSGYDVVFADVVSDVVDVINQQRSYRVIVVGDHEQEVMVDNVRAVTLNTPTCSEQVIDATLITTAVGIRNLPAVAEIIAAGLTQRSKQHLKEYVNVLACENAINATDTLKTQVYEHLDAEVKAYVDAHVGFANVAVDRIAPNFRRTGAKPLDVVVEEFFEWDIEKVGLVGLVKVDGATFVDELGPYLERKLFLLNGTHAAVAYLGYLKHAKTIYEAMQDSWVLHIAKGIQSEAMQGLIHAYPQLTKASLEGYSNTIIKRFFNVYLEDDVIRVGRDPMRKLSPNERLVSPLKRFLSAGGDPQFIPIGMAAGYRFSAPGDERAVALQNLIAQNGIEAAVREVSGELGDPIVANIVKEYAMLSKGF